MYGESDKNIVNYLPVVFSSSPDVYKNINISAICQCFTFSSAFYILFSISAEQKLKFSEFGNTLEASLH
jgi:hypothetical protein